MNLCKADWATAIDKAIFPGIQGGPLCTSRREGCRFKEALEPAFKEYQAQFLKNAQVLAEELVEGRLRLVSGVPITTSCWVDLTPKGITGRDAEVALDKVGITVNKNGIPFDTKKPNGHERNPHRHPCFTTRAMKEDDMKVIVPSSDRCLSNIGDQAGRKGCAEVKELTSKHRSTSRSRFLREGTASRVGVLPATFHWCGGRRPPLLLFLADPARHSCCLVRVLPATVQKRGGFHQHIAARWPIGDLRAC
jgi:glycine/serine hydroxymethyltransferase